MITDKNKHFDMLSQDPIDLNRRIISRLYQDFLAKNQVSK